LALLELWKLRLGTLSQRIYPTGSILFTPFPMKVLQHSSVCLVIQEKLLGIWLLSVMTGLTGVFIFFSFEPPVDWLGAFCIGIAWIFRFLAPTELYVFDRRSQSLRIEQRQILGNKIASYPISDFKDASIETIYVLGTRFYRVKLQMCSGQKLTITQTLSTDWKRQQRVLRHIRGFLFPPSVNSSITTS
jgi:hypothetical protein